jgi:hypothetical protein
MPPISTLTVQLELANQNFNNGLKTSQQAVDNFGKTTRQTQAAMGLMERGFKADTANKIAQGWENAAKKADVFGQAYKKAGDTAVKSTENAAASIQLLTREIGINLPEGVTKFLSKSSMIGPAMSAAFSGVAVLGLIQVLAQLPALFDKISGAITGWDETAKRAYANFLDYNRQAVRRLEELRQMQAGISMLGLTGMPLADAQLAEAKRRLADFDEEMRKTERELTRLQELQEQSTVIHEGQVVQFPDAKRAARIVELTNQQNDALKERNRLLDQVTMAEAGATFAWFEAGQKRLEETRRANEAAAKAAETAAEKARAASEAAAKAALRWTDIQARLSESMIDQLPASQFETLLKGGLVVPPPVTLGSTTMFESQFDAIMRRTQEVIDERRTLLIKANEDVANGQAAAHERMLAQMERATERMLSNIHSAAGHIFDMIFQQGASLADFFKGIGLTAGRTMFQNIATSILGGQGGGGLLGQLGRVPGLGGLLGFGGGAAASLGSTVAAGAAVNASWIPGLAIAAPAIPSIGVAGGAAAAGGGALAGLGALFTNPWTAIIGGGILGGLALSKLFGHKTQEAPFTADPFANRAGSERTLYFNENPFESGGMMSPLTSTLDRLNRNLERLEGVPSDAFLKTKMRTFYDTDNTFRRTSGSKLTGDEL